VCVTPGPLPVAKNGAHRLQLCAPWPVNPVFEINPRLPTRGPHSYLYFEATHLVLKKGVASEGMYPPAPQPRPFALARWLRLSSLARHSHPSRVLRFSNLSTISPPAPLQTSSRTTTPPTYPSPPTSLPIPHRLGTHNKLPQTAPHLPLPSPTN